MKLQPDQSAVDLHSRATPVPPEILVDESRVLAQVMQEIGTVVVGQRAMLDRLLIGLLADGHVLLEGVPGLAKTLAVRTLAVEREQLSSHQGRPALSTGSNQKDW